jgi:dipeptidyl aminopeptidase/acylaminoacyl peptidase
MHGTADNVVPISQAERMAREARQATYVAIEGGNHGPSNKLFEARTILADWLAERLGGQP